MTAASLSKVDVSMESLTDCMYFINGTCYKGDKCRFRHCRAAVEQTKTCLKWPNTCKNVHCRYRHPSLRCKREKLPSSIPVSAPLPSEGSISFFWDIENVPISSSQKPFDIVQRIRQQLVVQLGLREIDFNCYGDTNNISKENQISLSRANVNIVHVPNRKPASIDRQILLDLDRFERAQRPPATIVLISGNIDFARKLSDLRHQVGFHVIVLHNKSVDKDLKAVANDYYPWEMFTEQLPPSLDSLVPEQPPSQNDRNGKIKTSQDRDRSLSCVANFGVTTTTQTFACPQCGSVFNSERALQQHQHDKEHLFACPICFEGFFTYAARLQHQYAKNHQEKSVTKCAICQKILKSEECVEHMNETGHFHFNSGPPSMFPPASLTSLVLLNLPPNARWAQKGVTVAGGHGEGNALNQLNTPVGLVVNEDQTVYVVDNENHRVVEWKRDATCGRVVAGGNRMGHLSCPCDVVLDRETDSLLVCDRVNRSVMRWSRRNGKTRGETIIKNVYCRGLTMDDQRCFYVSDTDMEAVIRFQEDETKVTVVAGGNGYGDHLNQLSFPTYLFVDQEQSVYVSDSSNRRVMKWAKGATEGIVVAGAPGYGDDLTHISNPTGLFVDAFGTVYVADMGHGRVIRWPKGATQGTIIAGGNGQGTEANQLSRPEGLSFDCQGNLYVADSGNHRVQRFSIEA